jgi:hypothetical protein
LGQVIAISSSAWSRVWCQLGELSPWKEAKIPPGCSPEPQGVVSSRSPFTPRNVSVSNPSLGRNVAARPVAKELFWGLLCLGGPGSTTCLSQALANRSPLVLASESVLFQSSYHPFLTSCQRRSRCNPEVLGLNLTIPKLESIAESPEKLPWPPTPPRRVSAPFSALTPALGLGGEQGG